MGQKTISRDISFLCHRVIALIKAQICDKYKYLPKIEEIWNSSQNCVKAHLKQDILAVATGGVYSNIRVLPEPEYMNNSSPQLTF